MNYKVYVGLVCIVLLFLSGCSGFSPSANKDTVEDFRKGSSGLKMSFIDLNQKELIQDSIFSVGVELENSGAYDITDGRLLLYYDSDYLTFDSDTSLNFELFGRSEIYRDGEKRAFFFNGKANNIIGESFGQDLRIGAMACYSYDTVFVDFVCIDKPYSDDLETGQKLCTQRDLSSSGQGSPVVVSSVDIRTVQSNQGVRPYFDITIKHTGRGLVTNPNSYASQCSRSSSAGGLNEIVVTSATLSDVELDCGQRVISLVDDTATLRCSTFSEIQNQFLPIESPLQIELDYGYAQSDSVDVKIIR